jgi:hypothetical protein
MADLHHAGAPGFAPMPFMDTGQSVPMPVWIRDGPHCKNWTASSGSDRPQACGFFPEILAINDQRCPRNPRPVPAAPHAIRLEPTDVTQPGQVTNLRFRAVKYAKQAFPRLPSGAKIAAGQSSPGDGRSPAENCYQK